MPPRRTSPDERTRLAQEALRAVLRVPGVLRRVTDPHFARHGLSTAQWGILRSLSRMEDGGEASPRMHELGRALLVQPPSLSATLDRMERAGWLRRLADRDDQRTRRIQLTRAGRALIARVLVGYGAWQRGLVSVLNEREQRSLAEFLERLASHWEGPAGSHEPPRGADRSRGRASTE